MKAAALYHLLQMRARTIGPNADRVTKALLVEIQTSLKIDYAESEYRLGWSCAGRNHVLAVPGATFAFYLAGDHVAAIASRRGPVDLRTVNWNGAAEVWRQVAASSGITLPVQAFGHELGLSPPTLFSSTSWRRWAVLQSPALALAAVSVLAGWPIGMSLCAICATGIATFLCNMPASRPLTLSEASLISIGSMTPLAAGLQPQFPTLFLAGMVTASAAEQSPRRWSLPLWGLAGGLLGANASQSTAACTWLSGSRCCNGRSRNRRSVESTKVRCRGDGPYLAHHGYSRVRIPSLVDSTSPSD